MVSFYVVASFHWTRFYDFQCRWLCFFNPHKPNRINIHQTKLDWVIHLVCCTPKQSIDLRSFRFDFQRQQTSSMNHSCMFNRLLVRAKVFRHRDRNITHFMHAQVVVTRRRIPSLYVSLENAILRFLLQSFWHGKLLNLMGSRMRTIFISFFCVKQARFLFYSIPYGFLLNFRLFRMK